MARKYSFLVTSGGTREAIDGVRFITNVSTGTLGSRICDALARLPGCEKVFYVRAPGAERPCSEKAVIVPVSDTASVMAALTDILRDNEIDGIVHAMAVSDYRVKSVRTGDGRELERGRKISSGEKEITLVLEAAPKIISMFRRLAPRAHLAGFKLLCGVTTEELIDAARALLQRNACAFVITNDKDFITEAGHRALMIDKDGGITEYLTKKEIADGIADKMALLLDGGGE